MQNSILTLLLIGITIGSGFSQESLTFNDCLELAIKKDHEIQLTRINNRQLDIRKSLIKKERWLPSVDLVNNIGLQIGKTVDPTTNSFGTGGTFTQAFGISAGYDILDGGRSNSILDINKLNRAKTDGLIESRTQELSLDVFTAYMQALLIKQQLNLHDNNITKSKSKLETAKIKMEKGVVSLSEYYLLQAELSRHQKQFELSKEEYNFSILELRSLMEYPSEASFEITDIMISDLSHNDSENYSDWWLQAKASAASVQLYELEREIIHEEIELEGKQQNPRLTISANLFTNYSSRAQQVENYSISEINRSVKINGELKSLQTEEISPIFSNMNLQDQWGDNFGQNVNIQLSYPIGNLFTKSNRVQLKQSELEVLSQEQRRQEIELSNQWYALQSQIESIMISLSKLREEIDYLEKYSAIKKEAYELGNSPMAELLELRQDLDNLDLQHIKLEYELFYKRQVLIYTANAEFPIFTYLEN